MSETTFEHFAWLQLAPQGNEREQVEIFYQQELESVDTLLLLLESSLVASPSLISK